MGGSGSLQGSEGPQVLIRSQGTEIRRSGPESAGERKTEKSTAFTVHQTWVCFPVLLTGSVILTKAWIPHTNVEEFLLPRVVAAVK